MTARGPGCTDVAQLGHWLERAFTAASVAEVLAATVDRHSAACSQTLPHTAAQPSPHVTLTSLFCTPDTRADLVRAHPRGGDAERARTGP